MPRATKSIRTNNNEYISSGVTISPASPNSGEKVTLIYDGILAKSGANDILAHVGFGSQWDKVYDYRMIRTATGFEASIPVSEGNTMNVCFKDCANNWDNNSGKNYTFDVTQ